MIWQPPACCCQCRRVLDWGWCNFSFLATFLTFKVGIRFWTTFIVVTEYWVAATPFFHTPHEYLLGSIKRSARRLLHNVYWGYQPPPPPAPSKTSPSFSPSPLLNLQTIQSSLFMQFPPIYCFFLNLHNIKIFPP